MSRRAAEIPEGSKFGRLVTLEAGGGRTKIRCRCDCGKETTPYAANLRSGCSTSCGCSRRGRARPGQLGVPLPHASSDARRIEQVKLEKAQTERSRQARAYRATGITWREVAGIMGLARPSSAYNLAYPQYRRRDARDARAAVAGTRRD